MSAPKGASVSKKKGRTSTGEKRNVRKKKRKPLSPKKETKTRLHWKATTGGGMGKKGTSQRNKNNFRDSTFEERGGRDLGWITAEGKKKGYSQGKTIKGKGTITRHHRQEGPGGENKTWRGGERARREKSREL